MPRYLEDDDYIFLKPNPKPKTKSTPTPVSKSSTTGKPSKEKIAEIRARYDRNEFLTDEELELIGLFADADFGPAAPTVVDKKVVEPTGKTIVDIIYEGTGKNRIKITKYSDGTETRESAPDLTAEEYNAEQVRIIAEEKALNEKRDAFALIESTMQSYGFSEDELKELNTYIQAGLLNPKLGPEQLVLQLRQLPVYKARFAGNEERRAKGLNVLSEADYLLQESAYAETMRQYGVQRFANRNQYATFIGNDISNTEVGRRVKTAVERLQMGDPAILRQLRSYYAITDSDIVSYFLNPKEVLPELESKVTTAEIGATAGQFGLDTGLGRASDLERYGVDLERARTGYSKIAQVLPRTATLSDIYKQAGIDYTQTTAEEEEFKGLASAKRAREKLVGLETAAFSGTSGLGRNALGRQTGGTY
jgi:hypothetical protein